MNKFSFQFVFSNLHKGNIIISLSLSPSEGQGPTVLTLRIFVVSFYWILGGIVSLTLSSWLI